MICLTLLEKRRITMTKEWLDGYNFAMEEIKNFILFMNSNKDEVITFRVNNGSKGTTDEIIAYIMNRIK